MLLNPGPPPEKSRRRASAEDVVNFYSTAEVEEFIKGLKEARLECWSSTSWPQ